MNQNTKKNVRFVSSLSFSVNLWTYQGLFLVAFKFYTFSHDSVIIIGSGFVIFIPSICVSFISVGLGCSIKILILPLFGKYSNIVCWVSKCVCWGSHHLVSKLLGYKIRFTIFLPFVSCYHFIFFRLCSLFLILCFVLCTKLKKKNGRRRWY